MQDYRNFPLYLTGDLWNLLQSRDHSISQLRKVEQLCGFLVTSLGLRHASETTQSVLVSVVARQMDPVQQSTLSFREDNFLTIKFAMIKFKAGRPNLRLVKKQTFRRQNLRLLEEKAEDKI